MSDQFKMVPRVFISYSHQDRPLAEKVVSSIEKLGMETLWDKLLKFGGRFDEQIKLFISHSHIFLPIITEASSQRGWVHQEIGYAIARNIPIVPVVFGNLPNEMLRELHAVVLSGETNDPELELKKKLIREDFDELIAKYSGDQYACYITAPLTEDRALLMANYANEAQELGGQVMLRQKGGLSSLHIPNKALTNSIWKERHGNHPKGQYHSRGLRDERIALGYHARKAGFKLIIDPSLGYSKWGANSRRVRLRTLVDYLSSLENHPKYQVAFNQGKGIHESITILGDWFYAESIFATLGSGYRQTIFTRHAPSMQAKIEIFDSEFEDLLAELDWKPEESRKKAIYKLNELIFILDGSES